MFNKLKILGLSAVGILSMLIPSNLNNKISVAKADVETGYTSTKMNWGYYMYYGSTMVWNDTNNVPKQPFDVLGTYEESYHYQNFVGKETDIFGETYWNQLETTPISDGSETMLSDYADDLYFATSNSNIYFNNKNDFKLAFQFSEELLSTLVSIADKTNKSFQMPCITFDDEIFSYFDVSRNGVNIWTLNQYVKKAELTYFDNSYYSGNERRYVLDTGVVFDIKGGSFEKIREIGILCTTHSFKSVSTTSDYGFYTSSKYGWSEQGLHIYYPTSNKNTIKILPYEITYFDYYNGDIGLGHSIFGEKYGSDQKRKYLSSISFDVISNGHVPVTYTLNLMSHNEYNTFADSSVSESDKSSALRGKFTYLGRGKHDEEVMDYGENIGSGSLVYANYMPYVPYPTEYVASINVSSMSFYNGSTVSNNGLAYLPDNTNGEIETYIVPKDSLKFKYMADEQALGVCTSEIYEVNVSGERVVTYRTDTWAKVVMGIFNPLNLLYNWASEEIGSNIASSGKNIQRFYFNMYNSDNQKIENIKKVEFAYQYGKGKYQEPNIVKNDNGSMDVLFRDDLGTPMVQRCEVSNSSSNIVDTWVNNVQIQEDGFVTIEDNPQKLEGIDYHYFYQHIYHTAKYTESGINRSAYYDFICAWTPLSIWYEHTQGQTIRLTTNREGYYISHDEYGNNIIVSVDNPTEDSGIKYTDFIKSDFGVEYENYDDAERNNSDQAVDEFVDSVKGFFESIGEYFQGLGSGLSNVLMIVLGVLGVGITVVLIIKFGKFLLKDRNKKGRKK